MLAFGLDFSDAWIRLALLKRTRHGLRLPLRGEIAVPPGAIVDGEIRNQNLVTETIRQLVRAAGLHSKQAYVSLPERHTFIKLITIPANRKADVAAAVREEASQHLPFNWDEVYFDFHLVPAKTPTGDMRVIIGAAPRTLVDSYVNALANAGVEPVGMEIESLAIARATIRPNEAKSVQIILDLGRTRSTLILLEDGLVLFSATVRYAGKELNQYIADELHITEAQAERAKRIFGLDAKRGKGLLRRVLVPQIDVLVSKLQEVEQYYLEHFNDHQPISEVVLTGSGALLRSIDQVLAERFERPVVIRPSWVFRQLQSTDPGLNPELGYTYATALGLSLLNFEAVL